METLRPRLHLLDEAGVDGVIADAFRVLATVGFQGENEEALALLDGAGLPVVAGRGRAHEAIVRQALSTAPSRIAVLDRDGAPALDLGGEAVHFDPGSACLFILDASQGRRRARAADLPHLAWITESCRGYAAQATALVPEDVPAPLADRYRLWAALRNCRKPVVTGTFVTAGFAPMRNLLADEHRPDCLQVV
mgnify:CR=1 FL=1